MEKPKTTVFNLIILDESGSMSSCVNATIGGCNEAINVALQVQKSHSDTQRSLMSIYAFQSEGPVPSRYLCKNIDIDKAKHINSDVYRPFGTTPLLDAIGATLTDLKAVASTHEDATAVVTIITDGMENSSKMYNYTNVRALISQLKELGWIFNFIGANIDVDRVADNLDIDNRMKFSSTESGTRMMYQNYNECYASAMEDRIAEEASLSVPERIEARKLSAKRFFSKKK